MSEIQAVCKGRNVWTLVEQLAVCVDSAVLCLRGDRTEPAPENQFSLISGKWVNPKLSPWDRDGWVCSLNSWGGIVHYHLMCYILKHQNWLTLGQCQLYYKIILIKRSMQGNELMDWIYRARCDWVILGSSSLTTSQENLWGDNHTKPRPETRSASGGVTLCLLCPYWDWFPKRTCLSEWRQL